jgi:uncharacterized repeat protein (TIGR03803 family)
MGSAHSIFLKIVRANIARTTGFSAILFLLSGCLQGTLIYSPLSPSNPNANVTASITPAPALKENVLHALYVSGLNPIGDLLLSGSTFYGMTSAGGGAESGAIFSIHSDGTALTNLYSFTGGNDGANPQGSLILSGTTLYGMTDEGGSSNNGTIFSIHTDGSNFTSLYSFTGGNDGAYPQGSFILSGTTLYGMASEGGNSGEGTIFSIQTDGSNFTSLYSFTGGNDGANPQGSLILSGTTLYGMTYEGGSSNNGTIFSIHTDGSNFTSLYSFTGGNDGAGPNGDLILSGSTLYGMTFGGGSSNNGTIFSIQTDGSNFTSLYSFTGGNDGGNPYGSLILSSGTLYGMTVDGGSSGEGAIFSIHTDGSGFTSLYSFTGGHDGAKPYGSLILSGSTLYGMTQRGGSSGGGAIFSIHTDGSSFTPLYSFTEANDVANPFGSLILSGSTLYGMAAYGGSSGNGTIFSMHTDGSGFTSLYSFTGGNDGAYPYGDLILSGSTLYGMTWLRGSSGHGTIFSMHTDGSNFTSLYSFTGGSDGANPYGSLILLGSTLYGMTVNGGSLSQGAIFSIHTDGSNFTSLYSFTGGSDGANPHGSLILSGSTLYGMTSQGGSSNSGTIFSIHTDGSNFTSLYSFTGGNDGANPYGSLVLSGRAARFTE